MAGALNTTLSRRAILSGGAAGAFSVAISAPVVASAPAAPDPIFAVIARHRTALERYRAIGAPIFEMIRDGDWVSDADDALYVELSNDEIDATTALQSAVPQTAAGLKAVIEYALELLRADSYVAPTIFYSALLKSPVLAG